jgi:putative membrane protein
MKKKFSGTWKEAFGASPGPESVRQAAVLYIKGLCMGSADVIPGVSGGTIALITGIYEQLIAALKSLDFKVVQRLLVLDIKGMLAEIHIRFLASLLLGILTAILSLARLMNYLLAFQPVSTWSFFFGLIAASILVMGKQVDSWSTTTVIWFVAGIIAASVIVNLLPVTTPEALWFIFLCGVVAICAMILPGISGAFILLILGKYEFITGTLKNPFLAQNMVIILVFAVGCVVGLAAFSRVLNYLLQRFHNLTLAFLTGLITGSLQKIWPWKQVLGTREINGKLQVIWGRPILPAGMDNEVVTAVLLALLGFIVVLVIERLSRQRG